MVPHEMSIWDMFEYGDMVGWFLLAADACYEGMYGYQSQGIKWPS
jgi:hypothetical protein